MYLTKNTVYLFLIIFLIIIYINNRNKKYGFNNIESYIDLGKQSKVDDKYINIINENTEILKDKLNELNQYYIYKLLETIFLKKTEINILNLLMKNESKCNSNCMVTSKRNIISLEAEINYLNNMIHKLEIKDKDTFIKNQLICISDINANSNEECLNILESNYYKDTKTDDEIRTECITKYSLDNILCKKPTDEIRFTMSKNKCIESHSKKENKCIKIPEEIEFMTQPNIYKYIKDLEEQIKQQEPKLNRFLCYKCIKKFKDGNGELNVRDKEQCKKVCKNIIEDIQDKKKGDYIIQQRLFLKQQQLINEYYEKQYKQSDGITSKTLKKIFNGEDAISNSYEEDINDIYKYINVTKHEISELEFNDLYYKINSKLNQDIKLKQVDFDEMYILFNNNYTIKYISSLFQIIIILEKKKILNILKNNIKTINEEKQVYQTMSNENRDILSHVGYNKELPNNDSNKKHFTIPNLPEFYDLFKIQKDLRVNYTDLESSPLPIKNNIYDSKYQQVSFN